MLEHSLYICSVKSAYNALRQNPTEIFAQPERRPGAVTQRRWDTLSDEEQVDEAIDHGFDGMIVYVDEAGKPSAFYTGGWKDREKNTYRPGIII